MNKHEVKLKLADDSFDNTGSFEGFASVFGNEDSYGDIVMSGAFTRTIKNRMKANGKPDFPILWNHNSSEPLGVTIAMTEDAKGLKVKGQLNLEVQRAREIYSLMRQGAITGLSIGYTTIRDKVVEGKRQLLELRLYEWSPVTFPANEAAGITAVKSLSEITSDSSIVCLSFSKEMWEQDEAKTWLATNGFNSEMMDESAGCLRFKQSEASSDELSIIDIKSVAGVSVTSQKKTTAILPSVKSLEASDFHALSMALKSLAQEI